MRGRQLIPVHDPPAPKASIIWAQAMKRIFNVDPLLCSRCGETMKFKSFIRDSKEIERICKNLGLVSWFILSDRKGVEGRAPPAMAKIPFDPSTALRVNQAQGKPLAA